MAAASGLNLVSGGLPVGIIDRTGSRTLSQIGTPVAPAVDITVTVPASKVGSALTDFPLYIDLSTLPTKFWGGVIDNTSLRAYPSNGTTELALDLVYIDVKNQRGDLYVKTSLATAGTSIRLKNDGNAFVAADATYGSEAVWVDYEAVHAGTEVIDRTGTHTPVESVTRVIEPVNWYEVERFSEASNYCQGIGIDSSDYRYLVKNSNNTIVKYNTSWAVDTTNSDPRGDIDTAESTTITALADCCVISDELWVCADEFLSVFNTSLVLQRSYDLGIGILDAVGYDSDTGVIYASTHSRTAGEETKLRRFTTAGVELTSLTIDTAIDLLQGLAVRDGIIYVTYGIKTGSGSGSLRSIDAVSGAVSEVLMTNPYDSFFNGGEFNASGDLWFIRAASGASSILRHQDAVYQARWTRIHDAHIRYNTISHTGVWTSVVLGSTTTTPGTVQHQSWASLHDNASFNTSRSALGPRTSGGGPYYSVWDNTNGWIVPSPSPAPTQTETKHLAAVYNDTTDRKLYVDGTNTGTDTTITEKFASGTMDFRLGSNGDAGGETDGFIGFGYLRLEAMSADWLAAESENQLTPTTFYSAVVSTDIATITVPAANVDSTLTDFPLFVDLATMPATFWDGLDSTGSQLRVYESDGVTQLAFDIAYFDATTKVGNLYIKTDLSSSADTVVRIKNSGSGLLAVDATYGRDATWADYEVVFAGNTSDDRTGNATSVTTGTPTESGIDGWLIDTDGEGIYSINNADTDGSWTLSGDVKIAGSSAYPDVFGYNYADTGSSRLSVTYDAANDRFDVWDGSNGNLTGGTQNVLEGEWHCVSVRYDTSTDRRIFLDGVQKGIDSTITALWGSGASKKVIMGNGQSANNDSDSYNRYLAFRNAVLTTDWILTEGENHSVPSTFYSVVGIDFDISVTVASGTVDSDLTDFPLYIDLSDMPSDFWDGVDSTGSGIRVYSSNGTTQLPFDIAAIDTTNKVGAIYIKTSLTTASDTTVRVKNDGNGLLAVTDTYGRNAVWSDYEVVFAGNTLPDRTGNHGDFTTGGTLTLENDSVKADNGGAITSPSTITGQTTFTIACDMEPHTNDTSTNHMAWYSSDQIEILYSLSGTDGVKGYDLTNGYLNTFPASEWNIGDRVMYGLTVSGTTYRRQHRYPSAYLEDSGITAVGGGASEYFQVGYASANSWWYCRYAYLRFAVLTEAWLDAEFSNHQSASTFYTVGVTVPAAGGGATDKTIAAASSATASVSLLTTWKQSVSAATSLVASLSKITVVGQSVSAASSLVASLSKITTVAETVSAASAAVASLSKLTAFDRAVSGSSALVGTVAKDVTSVVVSGASTLSAAITRSLDRLISVALPLVGEPNEQKQGQLWNPHFLDDTHVMAWYRGSAGDEDFEVNESWYDEVTVWRDATQNNLDLEGGDFEGVIQYQKYPDRIYVNDSVLLPLRNDNLNSKLPSGSDTVTLFCLAKKNFTSGYENIGIIIGYGDATQTGGFVGIGSKYNSGAGNQEIVVQVGDTSYPTGYILATTSSLYLIVAEFTGSTVKIWCDGEAQTDVTPSPAANIDYSSVGILLGTDKVGGNTRYASAFVYQAGIFDGAMTTDERQRLEGWMAAEHDSESMLVSGHPYPTGRSFAPKTVSDSVVLAASLATVKIVSFTTVTGASALAGVLSKMLTATTSVIASVAAVASVQRLTNRIISAASALAGVVEKCVNIAFDGASALVAGLIKSAPISISASSMSLAALSKVQMLIRTVAGSTGLVASISRSFMRNISVSTALVASIGRSISMGITTSASLAASLIKQMAATISDSVSLTGVLTKLKVKLTTIAVVQSTVASLTQLRTELQTIAAASALQATVVKQAALNVVASVSLDASMVRQYVKAAILGTITVTGDVNPAQFRTISSVATLTAALITAIPSFGKTVGKMVWRAATYGISRWK